MGSPEGIANTHDEVNEEPKSNVDIATEYYGDGVPQFKGNLLHKIDDTRIKFEDDMADVMNSDRSNVDKQTAMEVIRKTYLSNQGENLIDNDDDYERWMKRINESGNITIEMEAMRAMELIEENGVDSGLEYIKKRARGDEAFEQSVTRTVSMFSNEKDEFSRKAYPDLFEK